MPAKYRIGCDDRRDLAQSATTEPVSVHGQPTAFVIRETHPTAKMGAEDAILFNQIRNARLPLVRPPAGHGHHEESNRGEIHDAESTSATQVSCPRVG